MLWAELVLNERKSFFVKFHKIQLILTWSIILLQFDYHFEYKKRIVVVIHALSMACRVGILILHFHYHHQPLPCHTTFHFPRNFATKTIFLGYLREIMCICFCARWTSKRHQAWNRTHTTLIYPYLSLPTFKPPFSPSGCPWDQSCSKTGQYCSML